MTKPLNIGMIGYGFMGRAHSNGYRQVNNFFRRCRITRCSRPCAAATPSKAKAFAETLGLRVRRDRLAQADRAQGHRRRRYLHAEQYPRGNRHRRGQGGQDDPVRKAAGHERRRRAEDGRGGREGQSPEHGVVQLSPRAGRHAGQEADRRRQAGPDLPLPRQFPARLDHLRRSAAGGHGAVASGSGRRRFGRLRRLARALHRHGGLAQWQASTRCPR